jgi:hypothetical protein
MFLAFLLFISLPLMGQQQALDNEAIIKLHSAGLSDDLIISTINSQPGTYVTTADALVDFKKSGISEKVIGAILAKHAGPPAQTAAPRRSGTAESIYGCVGTRQRVIEG